MFGLMESDIRYIKVALGKFGDIESGIIFGSRAMGNYKRGSDIDIAITGLRPGEKIFEELLADDEKTKPTYHEKIMIAKSKLLNTIEVEEKINALCKLSPLTHNIEIVSKIKDLVPEYKPNNSMYDALNI